MKLAAPDHLGDGYLSDLTEDMIFRTPGMKFFLPELDAARERQCGPERNGIVF